MSYKMQACNSPEMVEINNLESSLISQIQERYVNRRVAHLYNAVTEDSCFILKYYLERIVDLDIQKNIAPADAEPITIRVNSPGGSLTGIMFIISYVEYLKKIGYTIITEGAGMCCSAGFFLMMFGTKGHRKAYKYTEFMVHQQSGLYMGRMSFTEVEREYKESKRKWDVLSEMILQNTNITKDQLDKMSDRDLDWFMTPEEALELNIIDEII